MIIYYGTQMKLTHSRTESFVLSKGSVLNAESNSWSGTLHCTDCIKRETCEQSVPVRTGLSVRWYGHGGRWRINSTPPTALTQLPLELSQPRTAPAYRIGKQRVVSCYTEIAFCDTASTILLHKPGNCSLTWKIQG